MRAKKIGIDARLWNETGVGKYIRSLFNNLSIVDKENEYVWFFRKKEFETIILPSPKWKKVETNIHWHSIKEQLLLTFIFSKEKLDLLHVPYFSFPIFYPGKFIITIHDLIFDHYKSGKASTLPRWFYYIKKAGYHLILQTAMKRAEKVLTISNDAKNEIINHYHVDDSKIIVTYEAGTVENIPKDFSYSQFDYIKKLQPYMVYVGNAHPHKNVENLILAMKDIHKKRPEMKLVLVGNDRFFYPRIKKMISKEKLDACICIKESVTNEELASLYHYAVCFITASKMEGFGLPILEAMSMGCPVFASDISVFHEIYAESVIYINQNNPVNIAHTVVLELSNRKKIKDIIEKGYRKAASFSWKETALQTLTVYKSSL
jgi:glycosyltransferase involved in cell wall biosynthesis